MPLAALALGLALVLALWHLGGPLWGSEGRWAVVARGMHRSGDLYSMRLGAEEYPDKPFGSYWLVLAAARLTGSLDELAARLPAALSLVLAVLATFELGRRTRGPATGALAAALLATGVRVVFWGRTASADPQNLLGTTVALLLVLEASERRRWWHLPALGAVIAVTCQMKGLSGLAVPAFVALAWAVSVRGFGWLRTGWTVVAAALFAALLLLPFVVARFDTGSWRPLELLWRESVVRAVEPFDHREPWHFYLWNQFELLAPWSLLLPAALWHAVRQARAATTTGERWWRPRGEEARRRLFPLVAYGAILLLFSLSRSRRTYYLLPIAPFAALLVAGLVRDGLLAERGPLAMLGRAGLGSIGALGLAVGAGLTALGLVRLADQAPPAWLTGRLGGLGPLWPTIPVWLPVLGLALVAAGLGALGGALDRRRLARRPAAALVALGALLTFTEVGVIEPVRQAVDPLPAFCAAAREIVPPGTPVEVGDLSGSRLKWYLDRPLARDGETASFRMVSADDLTRTLHDAPGWTPVLGGTVAPREAPLVDAPGRYVLLRRASAEGPTGGRRQTAGR